MLMLTVREEARLRVTPPVLPNGRVPARRLAIETARWSQRVGGYAALPSLMRQLGVDVAAALDAAGLARDALDVAEARIPYAALGRLLLAAADRSGCAHVGLLAGRMLQLSDLGRVGAIVRSCGTVGEALRSLVAHQHRDSEGAIAFLVEGGATTELGYAIYHPHVCGTEHVYDAALAAMINYLRELCGASWAPSEVLVPHARRGDVPSYRVLLRSNPRFNAEVCAIRFPSRWMGRAIELDDALAPFAALEPHATPDVLQQVFRALRRLLLEGRTSGDDVAAVLGMNRRTLNRRLEARGTTFQVVLDEMRFGLARQLLSTSDIALDDVAANLGYSGMSPFSRTFHRWSGTAPGRWRRMQTCGLAQAAFGD